MSRYNFAKNQASTIMPILIDSKSGLVKFNSLARLHQRLIALGFRYARKEEYGPKGGWQLFYVLDMPESAPLVRIKTKGEEAAVCGRVYPICRWQLQMVPGTSG